MIGQGVITVEISVADGCNQITADKVVYIRKGAFSMQATSEEILSLPGMNRQVLSHDLDSLIEQKFNLMG